MLNLKKFVLSVSLSVIFTSTLCLPAFASENASIPKQIIELAEEKVQADKKEIPETSAWIEDLKGNRTEVEPLNLNNQTNSKMSTLSVPNDGYRYIYDDYVINAPATNWHYALAGVYRVKNEGKTDASASFIQQSSVTKQWNVGINVSGKAEIGVSFLTKLEIELGGKYETSKSYYSGTTYGLSYTIPGGATRYLANYTVGGYDYGSLRYKRYTPAGSHIGYYYEGAGGTAINTANTNVEILLADPT